ncbi:MAG: hypothetical protein K0R00_3194 [Herbinix sp.]|jgi:predicted phage replisome organizer|nr:hypothetical protein [Herbinix sp.]
MAKKYYWLKLQEDFFKDKVIKKLRRIAGGDTYVIIYLKMQLLSIKSEGRLFFEGIEGSFAEELALEIDEEVENVSVAVSYLEKHNLLESSISDEYTLPAVLGLIGSESESAERVRRYRDNKNMIALHCNDTVTDSNAIEVTSNTEKEIDIEIDKDIKKHIVDVFEQLWSLYPKKAGKGQISNAKKKAIYKIGLEEMTRAINRYKLGLEKDDWRKPQNGSTFFTSGYIDYLDANYSPDAVSNQSVKPVKTNKHNQYPQRQYTAEDYDDIEKKLLNKPSQYSPSKGDYDGTET